MGEAAQASQRHAEALLQNQVPETVTLAALARECGAHGATSFGAGFGGGVWALVSNGDVAAFAPTDLYTLIDSPIFAGAHYRRVDIDPSGERVHLNILADEAKAWPPPTSS
jgi:mevalonate kinase